MAGRISFFYKLFIVFFITGVLPLALLSSFFGLFSSEIIKDSYSRQSFTTLAAVRKEINLYLEGFRETVESLSGDENIVDSLSGKRNPDRPVKLTLYNELYRSLSGHIDNAAVHIISLTGFPSFSTQQVPSQYRNAPVDILNNLFERAGADPGKTEVSLNSLYQREGCSGCPDLLQGCYRSEG